MKVGFPDGHLTLDASPLINLLGCGRAVDVLSTFDTTIVEQRTLSEVTRHPVSGFSHVDILKQLTERHLQIHRMNDDEYALYLQLVQAEPKQSLGAGESAAIATAVCRKAIVVLDDRKARRVCREMFPKLDQATSLSLLIEGARRAQFDKVAIAELLRHAVGDARMRILADEQHIYDQATGQL